MRGAMEVKCDVTCRSVALTGFRVHGTHAEQETGALAMLRLH